MRSRHVDGTVRSLFDLSLGFEPDATGRENILYRGLLLGLTPKFMRSVQEQIVAFADPSYRPPGCAACGNGTT